MRVEFHPEALAEFRAAAEYYEQQQTGLGERFANAAEMAVAHIATAPESWRIIEDGPPLPNQGISLRRSLFDRARQYSYRSGNALPS